MQASHFEWKTSSGKQPAISQGNVAGKLRSEVSQIFFFKSWNGGWGDPWQGSWSCRDSAPYPVHTERCCTSPQVFPLNLWHSRRWEHPQKQTEKCQLGLPWSWSWWMQTCCLLSLGCQWGSPSWWTFSSWKWSCHHLRLLYFHWHCVPSCARTNVVARSGIVSQSHLMSFSFAKQHRWLGDCWLVETEWGWPFLGLGCDCLSCAMGH